MQHQTYSKANDYGKGEKTMWNTLEDKRRHHQFLPRAIEHLARVLVMAMTLGLAACGGGGGGGGGFDPFQGRPATVEDLDGRTFTFAFAANGGPFDPSSATVRPRWVSVRSTR